MIDRWWGEHSNVTCLRHVGSIDCARLVFAKTIAGRPRTIFRADT
jgi:hypothetical protein